MFGFIKERRKAQSRRKDGDPRAVVEPSELLEIMRNFPLGGKIRYYPEQRKDIVLDSIVIAYVLNDHILYTPNDIHVNITKGNEHVLVMTDDGKRHTLRDIHRFCFVIPYIGDAEQELDYTSRAELDEHGHLKHGKVFTLMSLYTDKGVPTVDANVLKRSRLRKGYFANHEIVLLEAYPDTLKFVDQRQQSRIRTRIPIVLRFHEDGEGYECTMIDFAEYSLKLRVDEYGPPDALLRERQPVWLTIDIPDEFRQFELCGRVVRKGNNFAVVSLETSRHGKGFKEFVVLDALDLKATLLRHPHTVLAEPSSA